MEPLPLIVIAGPTASGKTGLSVKLAKQFNGEVISADSRAIYKGMDVGAAKPTTVEQDGVPHWGLDLVEPGERFTVADFKSYTNQKITEIRSRGHVPFLVGGTGLYVDAVIFDYNFPEQPQAGERERWEKMDLGKLHNYCVENNIPLPENMLNKRYVINVIIRNGHASKMKSTPRGDVVIVGITTERDKLRARIARRAEAIFAQNVIGEARRLGEIYGWDNEAMTGNVYPLIRRYINGELSLCEVKGLFTIKDWQLAKRQITWLKRNEYIKWLPLDHAYTYLAHVLENLNKS